MGKQPSTTPVTESKSETKKTRTILTPAQRIAKMEADLAAEREKVQAKAKAKLAAADEKVKAADNKLSAAQAKLKEAEAERNALRVEAGVTTEQPELPVDES